jgi:hypothetical protein
MPTPTHTLITSNTLVSNSPSLIFQSLPQNYRDLFLVVDSPSADNSWRLQFNGDASNYSAVILYAYSGGIGSYSDTNIQGTTSNNLARLHIYEIMNYSSSVYHKALLLKVNEGTDTLALTAAKWSSTAPITSMVLTRQNGGNFPAGTIFSLYGIEA